MQTPNFSGPLPAFVPATSGSVQPMPTASTAISVRLDAELLVDANPPEASGTRLGASAVGLRGPLRAASPTAGTLVAQIPLGTLDTAERCSMSAPKPPPSRPPATAATPWCWCSPPATTASFDEVHDYANYPLAESFTQPEINGSARFELGDKTVTVSADGITNPRAADNLSGTLSLELWALTSPYTGGTPAGVQLAASQLGNLGGQQAWHNINAERPLAATPAGTWHIALLLREWASTGFVTRDYVNFPLPVSWPEAETKAVAEVKAEASPAATATPSAAPKAAPKAEPKAAPKTAPNAAKAAKGQSGARRRIGKHRQRRPTGRHQGSAQGCRRRHRRGPPL
jgi:hypothetical protein